MIGIVVGIFFHILFMFAAVIVTKVAWEADVIDDDELPLILSAIIPLGVIAFVGALWCGEFIASGRST